MAAEPVWQHDCPGRVEMELVDGVGWVICYVDEEPPPPTTRVTDGLQALYTFEEGSGTTVHDVSGVGTPLDLTVGAAAATSWISGGGLSVVAATMIASAGAAAKVISAAQAKNQITLEAWLKPASTAQVGPARIVTVSSDFNHRDFGLGQEGDVYDLRLRTTQTTINGRPSLATPAQSVKTDLTHVVHTRDTAGISRVYIKAAAVAEMVVGGDFSNWDQTYRLALANEMIGNRPWLGEYHLVAIYDRALSAAEVLRNFEAGAHSPSSAR